MSSFLNRLKELAEEHKDLPLIKEGLRRTRDEIRGRWNPNYRHDDPEEQEQDRIREEINKSHRFESFAVERDNCNVKWHICGHDYFWALSEILESARECIFILDWWLSPELYLRRPPAFHFEWRLDRVLKRKAEQGVRVYIIVYKEVTQTMSMSSRHTKSALEAMHPNIKVIRHPDHIGSADNVEFWSHHEKVVVVDNHKACIGGLDACFGRWDTHNHPLADSHPTEFAKSLFPGQDYNNARVQDFQQVDNYVSTQVSNLETGRMPWQDVHMTLTGPVVLDIVQHFVERWNEIKKRKYPDDTYDILALPHEVSEAPEEAVGRHPHLDAWRQMGRQFTQHWHHPPHMYPIRREDEGHPPHGNMRVQVVRSVSDWSHGVLTEHSIQNAYISMINDANHFIYIENQFFISNTGNFGPVQNLIAQAIAQRIIRAAKERQKFKVMVMIPEVPGFAGDIQSQGGIKTIMAAQWRTINRGGHSICETIRKEGFEPLDYIRFYHLRTYDRINAPYRTLIKQMEQASGVTYAQVQVALAREWMGADDGSWRQEKVKIKLPAEHPGDVAALGTTQAKAEEIKEYDFPPTVEDARSYIVRFEDTAPRGDREVSDNIGQHALQDTTDLRAEGWLGSPEEERDSIITELVYIHSKVMIVDDRRVIMGSANINDRSQRGDGDSEIALVVEDQTPVPSMMNGEPYEARHFAASLRRKLFRKHLGLIPPQNCENGSHPPTNFMRPAPIPNDDETHLQEDRTVMDPLDDHFQYLWNTQAKKNTQIYAQLFKPVPTDVVHDWNDYKSYVANTKPGRLADPSISLDEVKQLLSQIKGHLVEAPINFLINQKDLVENPDWAGLNPTLPIYI